MFDLFIYFCRFVMEPHERRSKTHLHFESRLIIRQEIPNSVCVRSISRKSRDLDALGPREVKVGIVVTVAVAVSECECE